MAKKLEKNQVGPWAQLGGGHVPHISLFRFRNILVSHRAVPLTFYNNIALMSGTTLLQELSDPLHAYCRTSLAVNTNRFTRRL